MEHEVFLHLFDKLRNQREMVLDEYLKQRDQYKAECERLERENRDLKHESKALRLQADTYFDEWQELKKNYTTLTNHIRYTKFAAPYSYIYIHLVNFIKELERD